MKQAIKQGGFVDKHGPEWQKFRAWLNVNAAKKLPEDDESMVNKPMADADLPASYRRICHHLALARTRLYSPLLIEELSELVREGHDQLYGARGSVVGRIVDFYVRSMPAAVRREWRLVSVASLLFYGPLLAMIILLQYQPDLVHTVLGADTITQMEISYDPDSDPEARAPRFDNRVMMWGFYIYNNTSIGFRTFASGLLYGLGTLFFLLFNGLTIGSVAGHLTQIGFTDTFWPFVAGHGAFELTAICLSGTAGLRLGLALLSPGRYRRLQALRIAATSALPIIMGAASLFVMAAFIEAFWSPLDSVSNGMKYTVAAMLWSLTGWYFAKAGTGASAGGGR